MLDSDGLVIGPMVHQHSHNGHQQNLAGDASQPAWFFCPIKS